MSYVGRSNNGSTPIAARRQYIAVKNFNNSAFQSYTTYWDQGELSGSFATVSTDAAKCPKGAILHENGRKLVPDANPGVTTYLVGVYDPVSFLNGFIDPNSEYFAPFNTDKSYFLPETDGDLGAPVYAKSVETTDTIVAGTSVAAGTSVLATTGLGYSSARGSVTQQTNKATNVSLNTLSGLITMNGATLNANTAVGFTLLNSTIGANDFILANVAGGFGGNYNVNTNVSAASTCSIAVRNITAGNLTDALVIQYYILKSN